MNCPAILSSPMCMSFLAIQSGLRIRSTRPVTLAVGTMLARLGEEEELTDKESRIFGQLQKEGPYRHDGRRCRCTEERYRLRSLLCRKCHLHMGPDQT